jgi:hypothetical protein
VSYFYLASFIGGLLLAVRLLFFGAERRRLRASNLLPLRRSEPAGVTFLLLFGVAGYLMNQYRALSPVGNAVTAVALGACFAAIVTRLAIATARRLPEHDPDDPRYLLQGRVGVVTIAIPADGEGMIRYDDAGTHLALRARDIAGLAVAVNEEVCIERIDAGVAYVERWVLVEQRL